MGRHSRDGRALLLSPSSYNRIMPFSARTGGQDECAPLLKPTSFPSALTSPIMCPCISTRWHKIILQVFIQTAYTTLAHPIKMNKEIWLQLYSNLAFIVNRYESVPKQNVVKRLRRTAHVRRILHAILRNSRLP